MAILCQSKDLEKNMNYLGHSAEMCMSTREWGEGEGHTIGHFLRMLDLLGACAKDQLHIY